MNTFKYQDKQQTEIIYLLVFQCFDYKALVL